MDQIELHVGQALPCIPDDLTLPQFIFGYEHSSRPARDTHTPWLIEDETGRKIGENEVSAVLDFLHMVVMRMFFVLS